MVSKGKPSEHKGTRKLDKRKYTYIHVKVLASLYQQTEYPRILVQKTEISQSQMSSLHQQMTNKLKNSVDRSVVLLLLHGNESLGMTNKLGAAKSC